jgi:hypothetical protein
VKSVTTDRSRLCFLLLLLLLLGAIASVVAQAREGNTYEDELRIYLGDLELQCASVKQQLDSFKVRADPLTGYNLKDAVESLCHCLPEKTRAFKSTLGAEELARPVSAEEYVSRFNSVVIDKCAAEQMRNMYGDECHKRFHRSGVDVAAYCRCMAEVVKGYSDDAIAAIAAAASDYLPQAADAEKNSRPVPERPPILETYFQTDKRCKR